MAFTPTVDFPDQIAQCPADGDGVLTRLFEVPELPGQVLKAGCCAFPDVFQGFRLM